MDGRVVELADMRQSRQSKYGFAKPKSDSVLVDKKIGHGAANASTFIPKSNGDYLRVLRFVISWFQRLAAVNMFFAALVMGFSMSAIVSNSQFLLSIETLVPALIEDGSRHMVAEQEHQYNEHERAIASTLAGQQAATIRRTTASLDEYGLVNVDIDDTSPVVDNMNVDVDDQQHNIPSEEATRASLLQFLASNKHKSKQLFRQDGQFMSRWYSYFLVSASCSVLLSFCAFFWLDRSRPKMFVFYIFCSLVLSLLQIGVVTAGFVTSRKFLNDSDKMVENNADDYSFVNAFDDVTHNIHTQMMLVLCCQVVCVCLQIITVPASLSLLWPSNSTNGHRPSWITEKAAANGAAKNTLFAPLDYDIARRGPRRSSSAGDLEVALIDEPLVAAATASKQRYQTVKKSKEPYGHREPSISHRSCSALDDYYVVKASQARHSSRNSGTSKRSSGGTSAAGRSHKSSSKKSSASSSASDRRGFSSSTTGAARYGRSRDKPPPPPPPRKVGRHGRSRMEEDDQKEFDSVSYQQSEGYQSSEHVTGAPQPFASRRHRLPNHMHRASSDAGEFNQVIEEAPSLPSSDHGPRISISPSSAMYDPTPIETNGAVIQPHGRLGVEGMTDGFGDVERAASRRSIEKLRDGEY